jgi:hypothetical protein
MTRTCEPPGQGPTRGFDGSYRRCWRDGPDGKTSPRNRQVDLLSLEDEPDPYSAENLQRLAESIKPLNEAGLQRLEALLLGDVAELIRAAAARKTAIHEFYAQPWPREADQ